MAVALAPDVRPHRFAMKWVLLQGSLFVFLMGLPLYLLADRTAEGFAWTIPEPLTAAFLGANYMAVTIIGYLGFRQRSWCHARVSVSCSLLFTVLTFVMSMGGLDYFHHRPVSWVWIGVYALVPVQTTIALALQLLHTPGTDRPVALRWPRWMRATLGAQAVLMGLAGFGMFSTPGETPSFWAWPLSGDVYGARMEPYVGTWLLALAAAVGHAAIEPDLLRGRAVLASLPILAALHLGALARYREVVRWSGYQAWLYVALLVSFAVVGIAGMRAARPIAGVLARR